jgi:hypothetical protein
MMNFLTPEEKRLRENSAYLHVSLVAEGVSSNNRLKVLQLSRARVVWGIVEIGIGVWRGALESVGVVCHGVVFVVVVCVGRGRGHGATNLNPPNKPNATQSNKKCAKP